jgi:hypothetical protein
MGEFKRVEGNRARLRRMCSNVRETAPGSKDKCQRGPLSKPFSQIFHIGQLFLSHLIADLRNLSRTLAGPSIVLIDLSIELEESDPR